MILFGLRLYISRSISLQKLVVIRWVPTTKYDDSVLICVGMAIGKGRWVDKSD